MKQLVFAGGLDRDSQQIALVEEISEALETLSELKNQFPGLENADIEQVEKIVNIIFAGSSPNAPWLLIEEKLEDERVDICVEVSKLQTKVGSVLSNPGHKNHQKYLDLGLTREHSFEKDCYEVRYLGVPLEILRPLLGIYLLLSQRTPNPIFDDLCKRLSGEESFSLDMIKSYPEHAEPGTHLHQLWRLAAITPPRVRNGERLTAGTKLLAQLAQAKRLMKPLPERDWFGETAKPVAGRVDVVIQSDAERESQYLDASLAKHGITMDQLPSESELRCVFDACTGLDLVRTLEKVLHALQVPRSLFQRIIYKDILIDYFNHFLLLNFPEPENDLEPVDTSAISYHALLWDAIWWVDEARKETEEKLKSFTPTT